MSRISIGFRGGLKVVVTAIRSEYPDAGSEHGSFPAYG